MASDEVKSRVPTAPMGHCIYCGRGDNLSDEHVVPYALGGRLVLGKASCPNCARITSEFEGRVLRGFMREARAVAGFATRRPKERPTTSTLRVSIGEGVEEIKVPLEHSPGMLLLPKLGPGAFLSGLPPKAGTELGGMAMIQYGKNVASLASDLGATSIGQSVQIEATAFVRMLAKIGYCYAVSQLGQLPLADVPVLPLILGAADDGATWVGSADFHEECEAAGPTHTLGLQGVVGVTDGVPEAVLVARVKLFANSGASGYHVVVQRRAPMPTG